VRGVWHLDTSRPGRGNSGYPTTLASPREHVTDSSNICSKQSSELARPAVTANLEKIYHPLNRPLTRFVSNLNELTIKEAAA
jgi:hypothetical protein